MRDRLLGLISLVRGEHGIATPQLGLLFVAPVLVGAAFAGTVMRVGALSTSQFQRVGDAALRETGSGIELRGSFYAHTNGASIDHVQFLVGTTPGSRPVNLDPLAVLDRTVASYVSNTRVVHNLPYDVAWVTGNGDALLEPGELAEINVDVSAVVSPGEGFTIEIRPPYGLYASGYVPPQSEGHLETILPLH